MATTHPRFPSAGPNPIRFQGLGDLSATQPGPFSVRRLPQAGHRYALVPITLALAHHGGQVPAPGSLGRLIRPPPPGALSESATPGRIVMTVGACRLLAG